MYISIYQYVCMYIYCSDTTLTGDPSSRGVGVPLGSEPLPPVAGSKRLTHWTSETVVERECMRLHRAPSPVMGMGVTGS